MRIISDFRDVYDCQHSMFDPDHVWTRRTEEVLVKYQEGQPNLVNRYFRGTGMNYFPVFLGNRVHYVFAFYDDKGNFVTSTVYASKAVEIGESLGIKSLEFFSNSLSKDIDKLQTELVEKSQLAYNLFMELRSPLGYIDKLSDCLPDEKSTQAIPCYTVVLNPRLHESIIPWQEIDPNIYRLHQHLEQAIFGIFGSGEPELLTVSDKDKLLSKGFDYVTSFRKMPREN